MDADSDHHADMSLSDSDMSDHAEPVTVSSDDDSISGGSSSPRPRTPIPGHVEFGFDENITETFGWYSSKEKALASIMEYEIETVTKYVSARTADYSKVEGKKRK